MLKIRLARGGKKKRPSYRIVLIDSKKKREGMFNEILGVYNPILSSEHADRLRLNTERIAYWLSVGAQPTATVSVFLVKAGLIKLKDGEQKKLNLIKGKPKAKAQKRLEEEAAAKASASVSSDDTSPSDDTAQAASA